MLAFSNTPHHATELKCIRGMCGHEPNVRSPKTVAATAWAAGTVTARTGAPILAGAILSL